MKNIPLTPDALIKRLAPPAGRAAMVLDTDTYNEVDDQFALAYSLLSPDKLDVQAIYAAPFSNNRVTDPGVGMDESYAEILRLLEKLGRSPDGFALRGSESYLPAPGVPVDSPAARDLVRRAIVRPDEDPLYVVAIGAPTNVASALLIEPDIRKKIVVVWLGGNILSYPTAHEYNLMQDIPAVQTLLDCGVPLVLIPCMGVTSHMLTTIPELEAHLAGKNALCDMLVDNVRGYVPDHYAWSKEIWDVAAIAWLIKSDWLPSVLEHSPSLSQERYYARDPRRHLIRVAYHAYRNPIFADLFKKLAGFSG